MTTVKVK